MKKFVVILLFALACCTTTEERKANTILSMASPKSQIVLHGKTSDEVRQIMGEPTFVRKENPNESWVFKLPDCAVIVFFDEVGKAAFTEAKGTCDKNAVKRSFVKRNDDVL